MTLGTFHLGIIRPGLFCISLPLPPSLSVFCGQLEVSIDAALLHKPLEPLTVCALYCFMMRNGAASWTNTRWGIVGTDLVVLRVFGWWCQMEITFCVGDLAVCIWVGEQRFLWRCTLINRCKLLHAWSRWKSCQRESMYVFTFFTLGLHYSSRKDIFFSFHSWQHTWQFK